MGFPLPSKRIKLPGIIRNLAPARNGASFTNVVTNTSVTVQQLFDEKSHITLISTLLVSGFRHGCATRGTQAE